MSLRDLLVTEQKVTEEQLGRVLAGYVLLAEDTRRPILTPVGVRLPGRLKVLLVLATQHAWRFVRPGEERDTSLPIAAIAEFSGLPGNTLRPILKDLKDAHILESPATGTYRLPGHSLNYLEGELEAIKQKPEPTAKPRDPRRRRPNPRTKRPLAPRAQ